MKDVDLKKIGALRLCGGGALIALATWGVWAFCNGGFPASNALESAFDGWQYGREDQKAASAALAAAGLDEWSWDDGRLLVPKNKKNEYQTALAEAEAYPKAPSESRRDAIREMSAFESETKTRMRELDACAFQLERTLERTGGIEYATVGVRARREQAGLTTKTVVTASIGVACREDCKLDANLLSAITVAAKHQLGVDANENISILDLKAGKSYFGSEKLVGNGSELALAAEKERVETYWRDKLLKTFDYMDGVRVSVAAELVVAKPGDVVRTEIGDVFVEWNDDFADSKAVDSLRDLGGFSGFGGLGGLETGGRFDGTRKFATNGRAPSAAERLAQVEVGSLGEIEGTGKPRPLATIDGDVRKGARNGGAFARLGNPVATRNAAPVEARNLAEVGRKTTENGVLSVGATERRGAAKRGVVSAGYRSESENEGNNAEGNGKNGKNGKNGENSENGENKGKGQVERVAQVEKTEKDKASGRFETIEQDRQERNKQNADENKIVENQNVEKKDGGDAEPVRFRVRALAVRIGTPRGYVRRVAQNLKAENAVETFATDETAGNWSAVYRTTEQKIIAETKNVALLLLRPLAEKNGWSENELARSVAVDVFADPDDFVERLGGAGTTASRENGEGNVNDSKGGVRDAESNPNGPFEVVANFGQIADTSEKIAEETTLDVQTRDDEEALDEANAGRTTADFWTVCLERARRLDAKTKTGVGVGVGVFALLALAAGASARRRKKNGSVLEQEENDEELGGTKKAGKGAKDSTKGAKRSSDRTKEEKRSRREKKKAANDKKEKDLDDADLDFDAEENAENRLNGRKPTFERNLRIARLEGKPAFAQDAEVGEKNGESRDETGTRRAVRENEAQNAQIFGNSQESQARRLGGAPIQNVREFGEDRERISSSVSAERGGFEKLNDFDDLDGWDDLDDDLLEIRSLIERERARVGNGTTETNASEPNGTAKDGGDATRRREALDFVARNPDRAAASLQRWLRPGA